MHPEAATDKGGSDPKQLTNSLLEEGVQQALDSVITENYHAWYIFGQTKPNDVENQMIFAGVDAPHEQDEVIEHA